MSAVEVARAFVPAINNQSVDKIAREGHVFIDSLGGRIEGRERMREGWKGYCGWFPDYAITVEETFAAGEVVALTGKVEGLCAATGESWQIPAAGRAAVRGDRVAEWRVWADNEPVRQILAKNWK